MNILNLNSILKNKNILIKLGLSLLGCILGYIFLIRPLFYKNIELNKNILEKENNLIRYTQVLERKESILDFYNNKFPYKGASGQNFLVTAFSQLEELAQNSSIRVLSIRQAGSEVGGQGVPIELILAGGMPDFIKFIYAMDDLELFFRINKFSIRTAQDLNSLEIQCLILYIPINN